MKLHKAFLDAEGAMNLQQIVELASALPEAIKSVPVDQLTELLPALEQIVEAARGVMPEEVPVEDEEPKPTPEEVPVEDEEPAPAPEEEDKKRFSDADVKAQAAQFADAAVAAHTETLVKARGFLDVDYDYTGKTTAQVQRDAIATQTDAEFSDAELGTAFKMLDKKVSKYGEFAESAGDAFDELENKEL